MISQPNVYTLETSTKLTEVDVVGDSKDDDGRINTTGAQIDLHSVHTSSHGVVFDPSKYFNPFGETSFQQNWLQVTEDIIRTFRAGEERKAFSAQVILPDALTQLQFQIAVTQEGITRRREMGLSDPSECSFNPDFSMSNNPIWAEVSSAARNDAIAALQSRNKWMPYSDSMALPEQTLVLASKNAFADSTDKDSVKIAKDVCVWSTSVVSALADRRDQLTLYLHHKAQHREIGMGLRSIKMASNATFNGVKPQDGAISSRGSGTTTPDTASTITMLTPQSTVTESDMISSLTDIALSPRKDPHKYLKSDASFSEKVSALYRKIETKEVTDIVKAVNQLGTKSDATAEDYMSAALNLSRVARAITEPWYDVLKK